MKTKFLILPLLAFSVMALPAMAQSNTNCVKNNDGTLNVTGSQVSDGPSGRGNMTRTGSLVNLKDDVATACGVTRHRTRNNGNTDNMDRNGR